MSLISGNEGYSKDEVKKLNKTYSGKEIEKVFSSNNLSQVNKISGPRTNMLTGQLEQILVLNNPEFPKCFTGYEKIFGKYTDSKLEAKSNYKILDVIEKYTNNKLLYILLVQDLDNNIYDIIEVNHYESLSESYGYTRPLLPSEANRVPNSFINKGELIYKSNNHDEYGNYKFGINVKTAFVSCSLVKDDGKVISRSLSERLAFTKIKQIDISLKLDDILLNIYGNDDLYKMFPDLGQSANGPLCVKRNISHKNSMFDTINHNLKKQMLSDIAFYEPGELIDIEIFVNDIEELYKNKWSEQLIHYYEICKKYHQKIHDVLKPIVLDNKKNVSSNLMHYFNRSLDYLSENNKFVFKKNIFEFVHIRFFLKKVVKPVEGFKVTGRSGDKGIIVAVLDDELMPIDENGVRAELLESPIGIVGRANIQQLYEHEINFCSNHVQNLIKKEKNINKKKKILLDFLGVLNEFQKNELILYLKELNTQQLTYFFKEIELNGIYVHQGSFYNNSTLKEIEEMYEKYNIKPTKINSQVLIKEFKKPLTMESERPIIISDKYILLLKQIPESKFSVRAAGCVNPLGQPTNTNRDSRTSLYNDTPVKMSSLVIFNLYSRVSPDIISRLVQTHALNPALRSALILSLILNDPYWRTDIKFNKRDLKENEYPNIGIAQLAAYYYAIGIDIKN